jgi:hypothetical protein
MRWAILVIAVLGCRDHDTAPVPPRADTRVEPPAPPKPDPAPLVRRADAAFAASLSPDYRQPMADAAIDRTLVRDRYLEACRAGDHRSCWIAGSIGPVEPHDEAIESLVHAACRGGDRMSCRAIRTPGAPDDLPGAAGRSCRFADKCTADLAVIERECRDGFPFSCLLLVSLARPYDQARSDQLTTRAYALAREGCELGLIGECKLMLIEGKRDTRTKAESRMCELAIDHCGKLGELVGVGMIATKQDDPIRARDAYERLCQYGRAEDRKENCEPLVEGYRTGEFPEPVRGRREELERWARRD